MDSKKGLGQDTIFLMVGILILLITALVIYALIGGPYCDDLAKKTANNIKVAVDTVAVTGTYTKDSPYTTYAMLCQNNVGSPLTLNLAGYRAFSTPEYMIYWEHFPESPANIAQSLLVFDESMPFTKNFAQIAALSYGSSLLTGSLSKIAKIKVGKAGKTVGESVLGFVDKVKMNKITKWFYLGVKWGTVPVWGSLKGVNYIISMAETGLNKGFRYIVRVSGISKIINKETISKIYGNIVGTVFTRNAADNGLVETAMVVREGKTVPALRMVTVQKQSGETIEKAVVPNALYESEGKLVNSRDELRDLLEGDKGMITHPISEDEKNMGLAMRDSFYYETAPGETIIEDGYKTVDEIVEGAGAIKLIDGSSNPGFKSLVKANMDVAEEAYTNAIAKFAEQGLIASRPVSGMIDNVALIKISDETVGRDIMANTGLFVKTADNKLVPSDAAKQLYDQYAEETGGKISQKVISEPDVAYQNEKLFLGSGNFLIPSYDSDAVIPLVFEDFAKAARRAAIEDVPFERRPLKLAIDKMIDNPGAITDDEINIIAKGFSDGSDAVADTMGFTNEQANAFASRLKFNDYDKSKKFVSQYAESLRNTRRLPPGVIDPAYELDDVMEFATFEAAMKSDPAMLAAVTDDTITAVPKNGAKSGEKGWIRLLKTDAYTFMGPDYGENQIKYAYLKSPNAGCELNTVCLNQKTVEQKKVDVKEEQLKEYESAYVVSKDVVVKLKRDGFVSPIGAGIGSFVFEKYPRFHLVSPCLAEVNFYEDGVDKDTKKPQIMSEVDPCYTPDKSNYCYFPEGKFNEMAAGFYGSLACSIAGDVLKPLAGLGFLVQPACASIEIYTEYDTSWPFKPFAPLKKEDMNVFSCNVEKNPKAAARLAITSCCNIAQCDPDFVCSEVQYSDKNKAICGKDKCTLSDLAKTAEEDYKTTCGCQ